MKLHESMKAARREHKMSGVAVAEILGMSAAAYRRYERGEVVPNATVILALSDLFNCSPTALMQTGGIDASATPRRIQRLEVDLREGEVLTFEIHARVISKDKHN